MAKKEVIIVVPGVKGLSEWPRLAAKACYLICRILNFRPAYEDHLNAWKKKIGIGKNKVIWLQWSRTPDLLSRYIAVKRLRKLVNSFKNRRIKLVGISMGGKIILQAIKNNYCRNIKKVVLVCSINETRKFAEKGIKVVNLYSPSDNFAEVAIEIFSFFNGSKKLYGKNNSR